MSFYRASFYICYNSFQSNTKLLWNIIDDYICETNFVLNKTNQKSGMINQNGFLETYPNQMTYELSKKRLFNSNSLYCPNEQFSRNNNNYNNIFNNKLLFWTLSKPQLDIQKEINPMQGNIHCICKINSFGEVKPNYFNKAIYLHKNKPLTNYANFINNKFSKSIKKKIQKLMM